MKNWKKEEIQAVIKESLPESLVVTDHDEKGHWYKVMDGSNARYPSVTGKLQILKDQGIAEWKMNRSLDYVFENYNLFNDSNVMEHLDAARKVPVDMFHDAGDIGTDIHDYREKYFRDWIRTGRCPSDILSYIPKEKEDIRAVSALRALKKFIDDYHYEPIATELLVYSHKLKTAGMLDDLGFVRVTKEEGDPNCPHDDIMELDNQNGRKPNQYKCVKCGYKYRKVLVLIDLKTSNQFKSHYFIQVGLYNTMLRENTGLKVDKGYILKVNKKDGTYKLEDLRQLGRLSSIGRSVIAVNNGLQHIKMLRKNNLKKVIKI